MKSIELLRAAVLELMIKGNETFLTEHSYDEEKPEVAAVWNTNTYETCGLLMMAMYDVAARHKLDVKELQEQMLGILSAASKTDKGEGFVIYFDEVEWERESDESALKRAMLFAEESFKRAMPKVFVGGIYDKHAVTIDMYKRDPKAEVDAEPFSKIEHLALSEFGILIAPVNDEFPETVEQGTELFFI